MSTIALKLFVGDHIQEFLIAELSDLDFASFEQEDEHLTAYIPSTRWDDVKRERIQSWLSTHGLTTQFEEVVLADGTWDRQWMDTVEPIAVPPFLVKPTWRDVPPQHRELILLEIDPKMSFGTGVHESTRLVLRLLPSHVAERDRVLDAGTGTGILAVAAIKLGAASVDAFDIDPWSHQNARENFYLNDVVDHVRMHDGGIGTVPPSVYDVILANINLHVIFGLMESFEERLDSRGRLLCSGILTKDRDRLVDAAAASGMIVHDELMEGDWWAGAFERRE